MKCHLLIAVAVVAIGVGAMIALPSVSAAQAPAMGGGYSNVIPIPVDDPSVKAIAGALFKPAGAGPFPAVVYMSGCAGLGVPPEVAQEKVVIDRLMAKGVATHDCRSVYAAGRNGGCVRETRRLKRVAAVFFSRRQRCPCGDRTS